MKKLVLLTIIVAFAVSPVFGVDVYTSEADFTNVLQAGFYQEGFDYDPWRAVEPEIADGQTFSDNGWAYSISSIGTNYGLSGQPMADDGGAVAPYHKGDSIVVTFTDQLPTAVGGVFWTTDINGNFLSGSTVTITLDNGENYQYSDSSDWDAFTGFVSDTPISSMTLSGSNWTTMDNLTVGIPEPATIGLLGLGALSLIRRRRRA